MHDQRSTFSDRQMIVECRKIESVMVQNSLEKSNYDVCAFQFHLFEDLCRHIIRGNNRPVHVDDTLMLAQYVEKKNRIKTINKRNGTSSLPLTFLKVVLSTNR